MKPSDIVPFEPVSPSEYWKIRSCDIQAFAQRRGPPKHGFRIVFEHIRNTGEAIRVEVSIDRPQSLETLLPFLDAARDLPLGFRLEAYALESVPWDRNPPPRRWLVTDR